MFTFRSKLSLHSLTLTCRRIHIQALTHKHMRTQINTLSVRCVVKIRFLKRCVCVCMSESLLFRTEKHFSLKLFSALFFHQLAHTFVILLCFYMNCNSTGKTIWIWREKFTVWGAEGGRWRGPRGGEEKHEKFDWISNGTYITDNTTHAYSFLWMGWHWSAF